MTEAVSRIVAQLDGLSHSERAELAHAVLRSLEPEETGVEEAWEREVARRVDEIKCGKAIGIPADKVFADLREKYSS